ncbi:TetR family transcriptional regulator [Mobilicoccus massiliensis]|uniref:TetR family transcriptional regulator n=1 Tax=Mobilicoccus massiliensis TaxID=1522310 RepID=UPI000694CE7C|nr:TetR family transcriptional regulator [Mobilicoccus massiliensis]
MSDVDSFASPGEGGLRARKKKLTRRAIHQAALTLVSSRGLDHVTTDEIAAAADVSARTFFNYFPTKEAAVLGLPPDLDDLLARSLLARPDSEDLFTALTAVTRALFLKIEQDPLRDLRRSVVKRDSQLAVAMVGANRDLEDALVRAAITRHGESEALRARVMVAAVLTTARACYVHVEHRIDDGTSTTRATDLAAALREAFDLLGRGLAA